MNPGVDFCPKITYIDSIRISYIDTKGRVYEKGHIAG